MSIRMTKLDLDLTQQEPIPPAGVQAALALMQSGKLHRYGEVGGKPSEVSALEADFARELGVQYVVAMKSCGSTVLDHPWRTTTRGIFFSSNLLT